MALAGLADYGSSSEDEREQEEDKPLKATMEVEPPAKKKSLLPSADELFDSIDAPAFFGGAAAAKRQAAEITASRPTIQQQPATKKQATAAGPKPVASTSSKSPSTSLPKPKPGAHMLPPQVSRPGGRNVVTEDAGAWMSKTALAKAKEAEVRRKSGEGKTG